MSRPVYVLIGGRGFMGGAYATHLRRAGHDVLIVGRDDGIDESTRGLLTSAPGRHCVVVDFAYTSVPNSSFSDPVRDFSDNLHNVLRHVEFAKQLPSATYVYVSSGGTVYGNSTAHAPIREDHRNVPLSPYGITKLACERYVLMYREVHGVDVRIVRPSNVYGPGQRPFRGQGIVATVLAQLLAGRRVQVYGDGSTVRDYLFIDDFCTALDVVIAAGGNGEIYNVGSSTGVSIAQLLDVMKGILDLTALDIERLPARPFDVRYNVLNSDKLMRLHHWRPNVRLDSGVARTAAWLRESQPSESRGLTSVG